MRPLRTKFLINPDFQIRFMRFVIISCVLVCSISLMAQYFFIEWLLNIIRDTRVLPLEVVLDLVEISEQALSITMTLIFAAMLIIITLALFYSHRIAGPIYNMKKTMDSFLNGDRMAKITLRKDDYLEDLGDKINELMKKRQ